MEDHARTGEEADFTLTSPGRVPFPFTILVRGARATENPAISLTVTGKDALTRFPKTVKYHLMDRSHLVYLDLFAKLAHDFGLRLPQNRKPAPQPDFKVTYREVLTHNLAPGMYYGYGDPAVIQVKEGKGGEDSWYYLLTTSNDAPDSFPILRSRDLEEWEFVNYVFPRGQKPSWAAEGELISDFWAPEMHQVGREFWVYFVARDKQTRELCIGLAKSHRPEGPFTAAEEPILKGNVIDPHVFLDNQGMVFLYWKEDNNDVWPGNLLNFLYRNPDMVEQLFPEDQDQITTSFVLTLWPWTQTLAPMERFFLQQAFIEAVIADFSSFRERLILLSEGRPAEIQKEIKAVLVYMKTPMYAQALSQDGFKLLGERTKVLENDQPWEAHLVEGMWVTKQGQKYYLFYAGNDFSTDQYGIGVGIGDSPLGPYRKMPRPILQSSEDWWAPGHPSLVAAPDGEPTLFLHAYFPGKAGYKQFRALLAVPVTFEEDRVLLP